MYAVEPLPETRAERRRTPDAIRRLVVPLDGTPYAEQAIPPTVALARAYGAEVILVRAHSASESFVAADARPFRRAREPMLRTSLYLARKEQELRAQGLRVESAMPFGPAADAIAATTAERSADLVVIATHLGTAISRPSQVSVARELMRRAQVPVLLLSSATRNPFTRMDGLGLTLLVPLEGTGADTPALSYAATLASALAGQVLLLRAFHADDTADGRGAGAARALSTRPQIICSLEHLRDRLLRLGVPAWTGLADGGLLETTVHQARAGGELIVLSLPSDPDAVEGAIHSAIELLRRASVPLLVVPQRHELTPMSSSAQDRVRSNSE